MSGIAKQSSRSSVKSNSSRKSALEDSDVFYDVSSQRNTDKGCNSDGYLRRVVDYPHSICTSDSENSSDESSTGYTLVWNSKDYVPSGIARRQIASLRKNSPRLWRAASEEIRK